MKAVKEYFVIEMHNSREDCPDYLHINKHITTWIGVNTRSGNPEGQREIAREKATQFEDEKSAKKEVQKLFGNKFKYRLTRHYKYT